MKSIWINRKEHCDEGSDWSLKTSEISEDIHYVITTSIVLIPISVQREVPIENHFLLLIQLILVLRFNKRLSAFPIKKRYVLLLIYDSRLVIINIQFIQWIDEFFCFDISSTCLFDRIMNASFLFSQRWINIEIAQLRPYVKQI